MSSRSYSIIHIIAVSLGLPQAQRPRSPPAWFLDACPNLALVGSIMALSAGGSPVPACARHAPPRTAGTATQCCQLLLGGKSVYK